MLLVQERFYNWQKNNKMNLNKKMKYKINLHLLNHFKNQQIDSEEEEEAEDEYSDFEEEEEVEEIVYDEEDAEVDPKDAELFNKYFQSNGETNNNNNDDNSFQPTINLADKILAKIQEKESQQQQQQQKALQIIVMKMPYCYHQKSF